MPRKTTFKKRAAVAAIAATVLVVGGSVAFATPAFADPTPATGPVTTISNLTVSIDNTSGRHAHIQYDYSIADPILDSDSIVEVTDFDSCHSTTVVDQDVPLTNAPGGVSLDVALPAAGYVEVKVYSSNGASAPLVSAPAYAEDTPVTLSDTGASFVPDDPPTSGSLVIILGNDVPDSSFQLYSNGSPIGGVITVQACAEFIQTYSGAPGDILTLHDVEGDFDAASTTIPGAAPADPGTPTLPTTGVGPGSWYAGGFGLAALFVGAVLLLVHWRVRRRRAG